MLPGGKGLVFTSRASNVSRVVVQALKTGARRVLAEDGGNAFYSPTGHILYPTRGGVLMALPFDVDRLEPTGPPFPVLQELVTDARSGVGHYAVSNTGTLVYIAGNVVNPRSELVWVDRKGNVEPLPIEGRFWEEPRLSPDGQQIALRLVQGANLPDVWIYQITRRTLTRLTFNEDEDETPLWSPDGKRVAFASTESGKRLISVKPADGSGKEEQVGLAPSTVSHLNAWSPDGKIIAFSDYAGATNGDIWILTIGEREPKPLLKTQFNEHTPAFSPDSRWLAYVSNESGRDEVYVIAFPGPGGRWQISTDGGAEPVWSRDGKELFYRNGDKMMSVSVETRPTFTPSTPQLL